MEECTEGRFLSLSAWHDGEVAAAEAAQIELHLKTCRVCQRHLEGLTTLTTRLQRRFGHEDAPARMRDTVTLELKRRVPSRWSLAAVALAACLGVFALTLTGVSRQRATLARFREEVVTRHLAGFARAEPCDIDSRDAKVVSAWLSEHAGYPVSVGLPPDAELLGGRVCHLCDAPTAAFMLRQAGAPLTLFVPAPGSEVAREAERLAESGASCTRDPLGFSVCACASPQPMLAVAEAEPALVGRALSALP